MFPSTPQNTKIKKSKKEKKTWYEPRRKKNWQKNREAHGEKTRPRFEYLIVDGKELGS